MSALAPQGGPPPGIPPQIQLGGGGSQDGPQGPPQGPTPSGGNADNVEKLLMVAKAALQQAEQAEDDHIDMQTILKCISAIQGILANRQKGAESAMGTTPAMKAMSRAY